MKFQDDAHSNGQCTKVIDANTASWECSKPVSNDLVCKWMGVACNAHNNITALSLSKTGIRGTLPNEIGRLLFLTVLVVSDNSMTGHLPSIGSLRAMKTFKLQF
jgi:hypothetical protein